MRLDLYAAGAVIFALGFGAGLVAAAVKLIDDVLDLDPGRQ